MIMMCKFAKTIPHCKKYLTETHQVKCRQWLWLSWQSGCFRHQRSTVQIQSSANFKIVHLITISCIEKTKIVVVAQLVEWSLLMPEVNGSNPVIGGTLIQYICLLSAVLKRRKQIKGACNGLFKKTRNNVFWHS